MKVVNALHLTNHKITVEEYKRLFPGATLFDTETKQKMKDSSAAWHAANVKRLSEETKKKISAAHTGKTRAPRDEAFKAKMREKWKEKKDEWSKSIKESYTVERRERLRTVQRKKLEERANPLLNWRENRLEASVRKEFQDLGFTVVRNKVSSSKIEGAVRYFDFYIPELNLLVEVDGEYWHRKRTNIDTAKADYARVNGFDFVRISNQNRKSVAELIAMTKDERWQEHLKLIELRLNLNV